MATHIDGSLRHMRNPVLKPIRYVFYRILTWKLRDARESTPVFVAELLTSMLLLINGLFVFMAVNAFHGRALLPLFKRSSMYAPVTLFFGASCLLMNWLWVENGRWQSIQTEFQKQNRLPHILFWCYLVVSVAAPIALAIALPREHG